MEEEKVFLKEFEEAFHAERDGGAQIAFCVCPGQSQLSDLFGEYNGDVAVFESNYSFILFPIIILTCPYPGPHFTTKINCNKNNPYHFDLIKD